MIHERFGKTEPWLRGEPVRPLIMLERGFMRDQLLLRELELTSRAEIIIVELWELRCSHDISGVG